MASRKPERKLKWKKTVVIEEPAEGNQLCLACGNAYDIISPCPPFPQDDSNFCPFCGAEVVERIVLGEDDDISDWVTEVR